MKRGGVLGVCRDRRCYLLVGPPARAGPGSAARSCATRSAGRRRVALALLPDGQRERSGRAVHARRADPVENTAVALDRTTRRARACASASVRLEGSRARARPRSSRSTRTSAPRSSSRHASRARVLHDRARPHVAPRRRWLRASSIPFRASCPRCPCSGRRRRSVSARSCCATRPPTPARVIPTGPARSSDASRALHALARELGLDGEADALAGAAAHGASSPGSTLASTPRIPRRAAPSTTSRAGER